MIDLRSDTVTKPTPEMLDAMFSAKVGDDVFSEDDAVNELQKYAADLFGKEKALFCPSGTMTNQIAIKVHTKPGDELICDASAHIYNYEGAGISFNSGVQAKLIQGKQGLININQLENAVNADYDWLARTSLVCLENTVNRAGGSIYNLSDIKPISQYCLKNKLKIHLDGARIFNALVETKESSKEIGECFDSISICLSKGLGAPIGSLLLGTNDFIKEARRIRKVFGGGMRQVGYLAAAGLFALKNNITRLKNDHTNAKQIEQVLKNKNYVESIMPVETNIIIFNIKPEFYTGAAFEEKLFKNKIRISSFGKQTIRMVTHLDISETEITKVCEVLNNL
ncbi:MAG: threonine aldolase [Bacteroidetes bacterium]|nr:threonine aldolase [Bacteroidota bacterium]